MRVTSKASIARFHLTACPGRCSRRCAQVNHRIACRALEDHGSAYVQRRGAAGSVPRSYARCAPLSEGVPSLCRCTVRVYVRRSLRYQPFDLGTSVACVNLVVHVRALLHREGARVFVVLGRHALDRAPRESQYFMLSTTPFHRALRARAACCSRAQRVVGVACVLPFLHGSLRTALPSSA